ncbi:hypothetical protein SAMN05192583_2526 [Sphingomonas gellani]|uniref:Uncharacterized protein n=1 Tax=Sphingomonas gellani TaxID=1166340 RepID=A0A1H8FRW2_9SPHN|nr:hypothetical protein [Sphingomonas gellani]SEN33838.1 hypothetical protein SAMN05192583_2526 [Sphingomonas gellani]
MIAAYRLKGLGWFASCVAIVLGFYLVSLQVAAERKKLEAMNRQIEAAQRDIRALETEFDTRANLAQLEKWNGDTLALSAPVAGQYVGDEAQLAAMDVSAPNAPGIQTAALMVVPSAPVVATVPPVTPVQPTIAPPRVQPAVAVSAPVRMASARTSASAPVAVASASPARVAKIKALEPVPTRATPAAARLASAERANAAVAKVRPQAMAMLDRKLLSDTTLGDLLSGARAEAGRRR